MIFGHFHVHTIVCTTPPIIWRGGEKKNLLPMGSLLELKWGDKFLTEFFAFHTIMGGGESRKSARPPIMVCKYDNFGQKSAPHLGTFGDEMGCKLSPPHF